MRRRRWTADEDRELLRDYRAGRDIELIAERFRVSRSSLYRRLQVLEEPARERRKRKRSGYYVAIVPYDEAPGLVRGLLEEARVQRVNCTELAARAGFSRELISAWNRGLCDPKLSNIEAAGRALGLRLAWIEDDDGTPSVGDDTG